MELRSATNIELAAELDSKHQAVASAQRRLLEVVAECDRSEVWQSEGCRDLAQWLSIRVGISNWAARRWINAAHALPCLPHTSDALDTGALGLDKVVELCRFAVPETERKLIMWARRVSVAAIRRKADLEARPSQEDILEADKTRFLHYWWFDDGRRLGLEGSLPADQGSVVARALDRLADRAPDIIEDDCEAGPTESLETRRADALFMMASSAIADDHDPERATVVVHAELDALIGDQRGCEIEGGPVIHPETARRLSCDARLQVVLEDAAGDAVGIGRTARSAPAWLLRQLRYRDRACTFPGCESKRFLHAHHIEHWARGGSTDLSNLVLACTFHHKLVHEYGWKVALSSGGSACWFRPDGRRFDPGPGAQEVPERAPPLEHLVSVA
ncbi:MAG: DUF222 domain-containing protein [Actinobacteria bacterium]|nr:DUF222 domain-containing protein [Actinomycetota bacterium]